MNTTDVIATKKSDREKASDKDEPAKAVIQDDVSTDTTTSTTTQSSGGAASYTDDYGCWWPGVKDVAKQQCSCGGGRHYRMHCPNATPDERKEARKAWAAN